MEKNVYVLEVEKVVRQILPKFIERFNLQHNFELPNFDISIDGWPNVWKHLYNEGPVEFNSVYVNVKVQTKDGRLGRLKKLIKLVVEQSLTSLGYRFGEVIVGFDKELLGEQTNSFDRIKKIITKIISDEPTYQGSFSLPYSDSYDDSVDWYIEYKINDIELWKPTDEDFRYCEKDSLYVGTIYIGVTRFLIGSEGLDEWERAYGEDDIPSWSWDDFFENIGERIGNFIPQACLDLDLNFKMVNE